jgi:hypothetical protein
VFRKFKLTFLAVLFLATWSASAVGESTEQAVIVHFEYGSTDLTQLHALEEKISAALAADGIGDFDGDEVATSGKDGYLYMYGPSADAVLELVRPLLEESPFMRGARITRVYGELGSDAGRAESIIAP